MCVCVPGICVLLPLLNLPMIEVADGTWVNCTYIIQRPIQSWRLTALHNLKFACVLYVRLGQGKRETVQGSGHHLADVFFSVFLTGPTVWQFLDSNSQVLHSQVLHWFLILNSGQ